MKPISNTAFYCCGVRMRDAETANPVCGDTYAKVFMNEDGLRILEAFKGETNPNASNVARHRIIDDFLRRQLRANSTLPIILIGAGFDSRAYRLNGGTWFEVDEPQIIGYKNNRLPVADCKNRLQRIPIDFSAESLEEKLALFSGNAPTVIVIEGVFMYLDEDAIKGLLQTLCSLFPNHTLICDLMSRKFLEKYSRSLHEQIEGLGTSFKCVDRPEDVFVNQGYRCTEKTSIVLQAIRFRTVRIPLIVAQLFLRTLVNGYSIYVFKHR